MRGGIRDGKHRIQVDGIRVKAIAVICAKAGQGTGGGAQYIFGNGFVHRTGELKPPAKPRQCNLHGFPCVVFMETAEIQRYLLPGLMAGVTARSGGSLSAGKVSTFNRSKL